MVPHDDIAWAGRIARDANALPNTCAAMPGAAGEEAEDVEAARSDRWEEKGREGAVKASGRREVGGERCGMGTARVKGA